MDDYLSKPVDIKHLERILDIYLKSNSNFSSTERFGDDFNPEIDRFVESLANAKSEMRFSTPIVVRLFKSFVEKLYKEIFNFLIPLAAVWKVGGKELGRRFGIIN